MSERWRWIDGYEGLYMVSDQGRVMGTPKRTHYGHVLALVKKRTGYVRVCLTKDGKKRYFAVHRLVASAFVGNPEHKPEVNHLNGIRFDNRAENLEWVTRSENEKHAFRVLGKAPNAPWRNSQRKFARAFTDDQARAIRNDGRGDTELARLLGVSKTTIRNIRNRTIYKEVI